jgi:hypothetical protein
MKIERLTLDAVRYETPALLRSSPPGPPNTRYPARIIG